MKESTNDNVLSELVDGELNCERTNEVLLDVLDDESSRQRLKAQLRLRQTFRTWRDQQPARPVLVVSRQGPAQRFGRGIWRLGGLAAAAMIGGIVALVGFWVGVQPSGPTAAVSSAPPAVGRRELEQAEQVFALHESVAGRLRWYASSDEQIRLATAEKLTPVKSAIGLHVRVTKQNAEQNDTQTYLVVCRNEETMRVQLPSQTGQKLVNLQLTPVKGKGYVAISYAITMRRKDTPREQVSALAGQRLLGRSYRTLGEIVFEGELFKVEACAWVLQDAKRSLSAAPQTNVNRHRDGAPVGKFKASCPLMAILMGSHILALIPGGCGQVKPPVKITNGPVDSVRKTRRTKSNPPRRSRLSSLAQGDR